jgi:pimeloyl-ACP methyl ester carboxylesterase
MAAEVGVLIIHGMGSQQADFSEELEMEIVDQVGTNSDKICFESVYWAPILSARESRVWTNLSKFHDLDWVRLRKFVLNALGDATAYRYIPDEPDCTYYQIHYKVHESIKRLHAQLGDDKPVIVIAHSLGAFIMSNYIWDRQQGKDVDRYGQTAFERMESLAGFVTFGCNIPLFVLAYEEIECFTFPPTTLKPDLAAKAKWLNFFDPDDILGWPLKELSDSYRKAVTEDREINVGSILTSWNPVSHSEYWTDNNFTRPVAEFIKGFVE